jgi:CheY-like chemotaxis protein
MKENRPFVVLLAEDSEFDTHAIRRCWNEIAPSSALEVVKDGRECIDFLSNHSKPNHPSRPDLLLLDLAMPELNGFQVLSFIKQSPELRHMPVVILANQPTAEEVRRCYELGASAVFRKPMGVTKLKDLLEMLVAFWSNASLPTRRQSVA